MPVESPHDLYGLPLDRFIPERAALVKALRGEKQRDEAGEVAALRKPSVAAWAVNQLVRTQPKAIKALFKAGDDLVRAQTDVAAGKHGGDALRDASRRQREAVDELVQAAKGLLSSDGHPLSQATLERVGDTLRAAAVDPKAREQVENGRLAQELRFVGLGLGDALAAPPPRSAPKRAAAAPERPKQNGKAAESKKAEAADAAKRAAALKAARQAERDARQTATRADKARAAAQAHRDEAKAALAAADEQLAAADKNAEQAATELQNAERALKELG